MNTRARAGRHLGLLAAAILIGLGPGRARAEKPATIAVLSLAAQDARLEIYGAPVADALARELGARLGKTAYTIKVMSGQSSVPAHVDLVIDGRIVARAARKQSLETIILEAQVRDPERGVRMGYAATQAAALNRIDELARVLGARLATSVEQAMAEKRRLARQPVAMPETPVQVPRDQAGSAGKDGAGRHGAGRHGAGQAGTGHTAKRPTMVVFNAVGQAAGGAVPVADVATHASWQLAADLGYRPVGPQQKGVVTPARAMAALRRHKASYGMMIEVKDIAFSWYGVLAAQGRFRVTVINAQGRPVYDGTHRTATLVGSRGDRHAALVRFVMAQARDIARAELARVLPRRPGTP